jgi:hypothetical protein
MRTGVYRKKNNGKLYQFLLLARNQTCDLHQQSGKTAPCPIHQLRL